MRLVSQYDEIEHEMRRLHDQSVNSRYLALVEKRNQFAVELSNIVDGTDCDDEKDLDLLILHLEDCVGRIRDWRGELKAILRERNRARAY